MEVADLWTVELYAQYAVIADFFECFLDCGEAYIAVTKGAEGSHLCAAFCLGKSEGINILQVHECDSAAELSDQCSGIHAGKGGMRSIYAEGYEIGIGMRCKIIYIALGEHAGAVVRMEAQGNAEALCIFAHGIGDSAHLIDPLGVGGTLGGAFTVREAAVLAVVPLCADIGNELDLLLCDLDLFFNVVELEVTVEVAEVYAAVFGQLDQLLRIVCIIIADEREVLNIVIAKEFALPEGLLKQTLCSLGLAVVYPCPAGITNLHHFIFLLLIYKLFLEEGFAFSQKFFFLWQIDFVL